MRASKTSPNKPLSDPQVLQTPERRWADFIAQLPITNNGHDSITAWVDRLSRRVHFIPSKITDTAAHAAKAFFATVYRHHGLPDEIASDRDPKFVSKFWQELMKLAGVKLRMSTSHHPQTDGSAEVISKMVESYLRRFVNSRQADWGKYLAPAEVACNSATLEDHGHSPYFLDLGWEPKQPLDIFCTRGVRAASVEELQTILKEGLTDSQAACKAARARQSAYSAQRFQAPAYQIGDEMLLKKSLFQDHYSRNRPSAKLSSKKLGPLKILELVGKNAVKISMPKNYRIYPVIHVTRALTGANFSASRSRRQININLLASDILLS